MSPEEAKAALDAMKVTEVRPFGKFVVSRVPALDKDIPLFVSSIKTLGAWSVEPARVRVECGAKPDEIIFKLES